MQSAPHPSSNAAYSNTSLSRGRASDVVGSNPTCSTTSHSTSDSSSEPSALISEINDVAKYGTLDVLAARFLDPGLFKQMRLELPKVAFAVTLPVSKMIGSVHDINATAILYFDTIHSWMPIVSKKVFFHDLPRRLANKNADFFLLVLSMKLICARVAEPKTSLYMTVKQLYVEIESSGMLSIQVLQAAVLIAIYEIGHAIYPAAILSVGRCARYAASFGIDDTARPPTSMRLPWIEEEECCRIWWSIAILDRCVFPSSSPNYLIVGYSDPLST